MLIALDAGHGGSDPGAVYNNRQEKDDNLKLAQAVGKILESRGIDVVYTRNNDIYETPYKKAMDANEAGADYFVSFHRNSSNTPGSGTGSQVLIYSKGGAKEALAENIQNNLVGLGFNDLGVVERPNLVVLKRTNMPAVLVETGFINNESDNRKFDEDFDAIANAIANGIFRTLGYNESQSVSAEITQNADMYDDDSEQYDDPYAGLYNNPQQPATPMQPMPSDRCVCDKLYRVQVGAFNNKDSADRLLGPLLDLGFPAFIIYQNDLYKVQVGAYRNLDNAVKMEQRLRKYRYNTYITA